MKGFEALGATIIQDAGFVEARAEKELEGSTIFFDFPSVGGTQNVIMAVSYTHLKFMKATGTSEVEMATEQEIEEVMGSVVGYMGPFGIKKMCIRDRLHGVKSFSEFLNR